MSYILISILLTGVFAGIAKNKKNGNSVVCFSVVMFILLGLINYFGMPVLNLWGYYGLWWEILFVTVGGALLGIMHMEDGDPELVEGNGRKWFVPSGVFILITAVAFFSSTVFNSRDYNEKLVVEEVAFESFSEDVDIIPVDKMIVADHNLARKVVEDRLEEDPGLGSRCKVGEMTMQQLTGEFTIDGGKKLVFDNDVIWVAPLEHSSFWKWVTNDVTPGYMLVYASDPTKTYKITEINGKPLKLRYIETGCYGDDIERHIRTSGYATQGITEYNFEIDENGRPYWVLCNHQPTIGFGGARDAKGVITVDCQTGEVEQYAIEEAPAWIDHIQPEEFVTKQLKWWGEFKHGWWNSWVAERDVQEPTPGMVLVYSNGRCYWYTGVQSAGGDTSTSGFMLIDARTKEARYYRVSGVNEQEAKRIVEDQNFCKAANYFATSPVLYNVRGVPTYFMTLKGESGNVTGYAFMAVTNRQAVGVGSSKREAEGNYLQSLKRTGNDNISDGAVLVVEAKKLTVRDITCEQGIYYVLFKEVPGKEFTGSTEFFRELKWTKSGDKVEVTYGDGNSNVIPLDSFDNLDFAF